MPYLCGGCGGILTAIGKKSKVLCHSCGVLTDLRIQGFNPSAQNEVSIDCIQKGEALPEVTHNQHNSNIELIQPIDLIISEQPETKKNVVIRKILPADYQSSTEDDGMGYGLTNSNDFYCPACNNIMESVQIICLLCGYHLQKQNKIKRKHKVINTSWNEGISKNKRTILALITGMIDITGASIIILTAGFQFIFLFGTHGELNLHRNAKGIISLQRNYWVAFIQTNKKNIQVEGHDGIKLIQTAHTGTIEYIIGLILLIPFVFPAVIWYIAIIHGTTFEVALTRDMGRSVDTLFKSRNESKAKDIAILLNKISKLPLNQR
jgi:hypothetical protein